MEILKGINLGVAFALELAMLAGLGVWAFGLTEATPVRWALMVIVVALAVAAWAVWAAPKSTRRLNQPWLLVFKIALFGVTAVLLAQAGHSAWGWLLAVVAAISLGLAQLWQQEGVA